MTVLRLILFILLMAMTAIGQQNSSQEPSAPRRLVPPASCPVTVPPANPFTPPSFYQPGENDLWLGTEKLWTELSKTGVWEWEPHKPGHEHDLTVKIAWGSVAYDWRTEPRPNITITGRRLDGPAPPLPQLPTTHILLAPPHAAMLTGIYVPTPGCWEIRGDYKGQKLSFVVWVQPVRPANQ
jgi:hypothetical protein